MHEAVIVAIIFGSIVLGLAIAGTTILMAIKLVKGGVSRKARNIHAEEARMIQEIYQGLSGMEKRVEALETIVLDREGKEKQT